MKNRDPKVLKYKKYVRNKPKKRFLKLFFLGLITLIFILIFCLFSPIFNISKITVQGAVHVDEQELIDRTAIKVGTNIFKINTVYATEMVKKEPYIEAVAIRRILPDTVLIDILKERTAIGFIPFMNDYILFNENAVVLEVANDIQNTDLIEIKGIELQKYSLGSLLIEDVKDLSTLLNIFKDFLKEYVGVKINYIDIADEYDVKVMINDKFKVLLGSVDELENKGFYKKLLFLDQIIQKESEGIIDLRNQDRPSFRPGLE